ncbi:MAG: tRNA-dihydrouridine synthase [Spirochaetota bacterium]
MQIYLAPVQGITTARFRNAYNARFGGIDRFFSPFVSAVQTHAVQRSLLKDLFSEKQNSSVCLIPQILGNDGNAFRLFSRAVADLGYNEINWNIGCPFPTVTTKKKGAGILPYPDRIRAVLDTVCADPVTSLSVKMRLGMYDPLEFSGVISVLNDYPLTELIIHARTGIQQYSGHADIGSFSAALAASVHDVVYNGDIFHVDDYAKISALFPSIKKIMIGRGAIADPFLPCVIKGRSFSDNERICMFKSFHDEIYRYYEEDLSGEKHLCDKMKGVWEYFALHTDPDGTFLKKIRKCTTADSYASAVDALFSSGLIWHDRPIFPHSI